MAILQGENSIQFSERLEKFLERQKDENREKILEIVNLLGDEPYGKQFTTRKSIGAECEALLSAFFETNLDSIQIDRELIYTFGKNKKQLPEEEKENTRKKIASLELEESIIKKEIEKYRTILKGE